MKIKLLATAIALAVIPAAGVEVAHAQRVPPATILVVDTDRIFRECTACTAATAALQAQDTAFQQRRQQLLAPLQTEQQAIEAAAQALQSQTGAARTAAEAALRTRAQTFQTQQQAAAQELQRMQETFQSTRAHVSLQLNQRLTPIYQQVMTARGANLVVSTDARLAHAPTVDVTAEILSLLNQQLPAVQITPMPQQGPPAGQPVPPPAPGR